MAFLDLAKSRYSVRKFDGRKVKKNKLKEILEAGRIAPTAKNQQPQKVFVIQSKEGIEKINSVCQCIYGASTVLLVCYDKEKVWNNPFKEGLTSGQVDVAIVLTHMMMQAQQCGVNSCWVQYFNPDEVSSAFELPNNLVPVAIMPLGYATEDAAPSANHSSVRPEEETISFI